MARRRIPIGDPRYAVTGSPGLTIVPVVSYYPSVCSPELGVAATITSFSVSSMGLKAQHWGRQGVTARDFCPLIEHFFSN